MPRIEFGTLSKTSSVEITLPGPQELARARDERIKKQEIEARLLPCPDGSERLVAFEGQVWKRWDYLLGLGYCGSYLIQLCLDDLDNPEYQRLWQSRPFEEWFRLHLQDLIAMLTDYENREQEAYSNFNYRPVSFTLVRDLFAAG